MTWNETISSKVFTKTSDAKTIITRWKAFNDKVVFTNGCFDILHLGHIDYLAKAADLGDRLVIGLNADASVSRLKGENRPIIDQKTRAIKLASLVFVDAVVIFQEDTPLNLITSLEPDVLVKGGDYTIDTIVGAREVLARGGSVEVIPFLEGHSTTSIIKRIRD
jgi:rfaE bifunctional protein nucleotidyltransferase chain/domain